VNGTRVEYSYLPRETEVNTAKKGRKRGGGSNLVWGWIQPVPKRKKFFFKGSDVSDVQLIFFSKKGGSFLRRREGREDFSKAPREGQTQGGAASFRKMKG